MNTNKYLLLAFFCLTLTWGHTQVEEAAFNDRLSSLLSFTVPIMTVNDLANYDDPILILDAREIEEYKISHIPDAIYFGYDDPAYNKLDQIDKRQPIVLYCSVGYRSEKIGEKLLDMGFVYVYNLYGSIFEWANQGYQLQDEEEQPTQKVHTYNRRWSKWVSNPDIEKVW